MNNTTDQSDEEQKDYQWLKTWDKEQLRLTMEALRDRMLANDDET